MNLSEPTKSAFATLAAINVNAHVEKKGQLSYLSWPWALDQLLRLDPLATWEYLPPIVYGDTMQVVCAVNAFGITRTERLPVMDHRNKPIANPDAFAVNTAEKRCLVKAIALHGLGLYIYAGEDLPAGEEKEEEPPKATPLPRPIPANVEGHELYAALSIDAQQVVKDDVAEMSALVNAGDLAAALSILLERYPESEDQLILASQMTSGPRNKIKAYKRDLLLNQTNGATKRHLAEQA